MKTELGSRSSGFSKRFVSFESNDLLERRPFLEKILVCDEDNTKIYHHEMIYFHTEFNKKTRHVALRLSPLSEDSGIRERMLTQLKEQNAIDQDVSW